MTDFYNFFSFLFLVRHLGTNYQNYFECELHDFWWLHTQGQQWPWTAVYKNTSITGMACWLPVNICLSLVRSFSCCDSLITICFYFLGKWQQENEAASFLTKLNLEKNEMTAAATRVLQTFYMSVKGTIICSKCCITECVSSLS